jgi:hypothetical protein
MLLKIFFDSLNFFSLILHVKIENFREKNFPPLPAGQETEY